MKAQKETKMYMNVSNIQLQYMRTRVIIPKTIVLKNFQIQQHKSIN